jgi:hypothetical protein
MALHIRNQQEQNDDQDQMPYGMNDMMNGMNGMMNGMPPQYIRKRETGGYEEFVKNTMQRIRSSPKQMMGMIIGFILMVILIIVALHYFRLYSFPFLSKYIPQQPAPSSHLQYFFF